MVNSADVACAERIAFKAAAANLFVPMHVSAQMMRLYQRLRDEHAGQDGPRQGFTLTPEQLREWKRN